jgi:hypothetical protein
MHDLLDGSLIGVLDNGFKIFRIFSASAIIFSISFISTFHLIGHKVNFRFKGAVKGLFQIERPGRISEKFYSDTFSR